jgi:site-specific recombinase XerD
LAEPIRQFLAAKRALNRRFDTEEKALRLFDRHLVDRGVAGLSDVTPAVIEAFVTSRPRKRPRSYNHLLGVLRRLFDWMNGQGLLDVSPLRLRSRRVYATIFAVLYGLGLRVGEVARLTVADVDLARNLLVVRGTKFGKSRLVPFGPQMAARLTAYLDLRRQQTGALPPDAPVFSFTAGRSIHPGTISQTFHALVPRLDLTMAAGVAPPRVHDLRHSFAVGTLLRWYREGSDPAARLLHLSTFLGHVNPASTSVYLTITAELLEAAGDRFGRYAAPLSTGGAP